MTVNRIRVWVGCIHNKARRRGGSTALRVCRMDTDPLSLAGKLFWIMSESKTDAWNHGSCRGEESDRNFPPLNSGVGKGRPMTQSAAEQSGRSLQEQTRCHLNSIIHHTQLEEYITQERLIRCNVYVAKPHY
jgi:hypothetical protein